jgi:hypothetical protein
MLLVKSNLVFDALQFLGLDLGKLLLQIKKLL